MIGVATFESDHDIVREFFQLFKTPWEFCRPGSTYDVLLCPSTGVPLEKAKLTVLYGSGSCDFDSAQGLDRGIVRHDRILSFAGQRLPIYGPCRSFSQATVEFLVDETSVEPVCVERTVNGDTVTRLGFDLFQEVRHLLTHGQPLERANLPTLEQHISLLRRLIVDHGLPLVEIPPVPAGHDFIVSLTHDVDHPRVRYHKFDRTMFGFLYRALVGTFINFVRGRRSFRQLRLNWQAAFCLPLVFVGLCRDPWDQLDTYVELERNIGSTFFVIPFKGQAGVNPQGRIRTDRAAGYAAADISENLQSLLAAKSEIGVHGIDAWRDVSAGRAERARIQEMTGTSEIGVRMHWLYFDSESPRKLEEAGFSYDSTVGFNATIGYRAGTTQVFKDPGVKHLLELPLHIMDTALFYPPYMNLSDAEARSVMQPMIDNASRFGGVLTVNWHDRSLGPERLWGRAYVTLLEDLRARDPWFATAAQSVAWFRQRRAASFVHVTEEGPKIRVQLADARTALDVPPLTLRVYNRSPDARKAKSTLFQDFTIEESDQLLVAA